MERMNLKTVSGARFMDDICVWLHAIRLGWSMVDGVLQYRRAYRRMENGVTGLQKAMEILKDIRNGWCATV